MYALSVYTSNSFYSSYKFCSCRNDNKKINVLVGTCNLSACPCPSLTTEATACGRPRWTHTARRSYSHARTESLKKACISRYGRSGRAEGKGLRGHVYMMSALGPQNSRQSMMGCVNLVVNQLSYADKGEEEGVKTILLRISYVHAP